MFNVLALSAIGSGKSTLMNKLVHVIQNPDKFKMHFKAGLSTETLTKELNQVIVKDKPMQGVDWRLIDTRGFADPKMSQF